MSQKVLAAALGLTPRQIHNLVALGLPREVNGGRAEYPWPAALRWYVTYREEAAAKRAAPDNADDAKVRKLIAEARLAEITVAEKESTLVPAATLDAVVGELAERLRAVLINIPSQYGLDLERAGVPPAAAQEVLEDIAESLTRALRATPDEILEDDPGEDDDSGGDVDDA